MCLVLVLPLISIGALEASAVDEEAEQTSAAPSASSQQLFSSQQAAHLKNTAAWLLNKIIGYVSQIGAVFGQATGIRIGGTTGTAIAALVIAKLLVNKVPSWVKWLLYAGGGAMFAGSGANIVQAVMQNIIP